MGATGNGNRGTGEAAPVFNYRAGVRLDLGEQRERRSVGSVPGFLATVS